MQASRVLTQSWDPSLSHMYAFMCMQTCRHADSISMCYAGYTPAASVIAPQDLAICKKSDGSDFLLGQGTFGAVSFVP